MLKEPALKAAKVIKEAWKVKIFSLSSCRDALILSWTEITVTRVLHNMFTSTETHRSRIHTADFLHLQFFLFFFLHYVTQQFSKKRRRDSG